MKTKSLSLSLVLIVVMAVCITVSCKKTEKISNPKVASPWLAQMGTPVPSVAPNSDSIAVLIAELQKYRRAHNGAPVYYDQRLDSLTGRMMELSSSINNLIHSHFYVTEGEITKQGQIRGFSGKEESPSKLFAHLVNNESEFSGLFSSAWFWHYDIFAVRMSPCTDECHLGMWKYSFVFWIGIDQPNTKEPSCMMREYDHL
jgi:hypothetical protein